VRLDYGRSSDSLIPAFALTDIMMTHASDISAGLPRLLTTFLKTSLHTSTSDNIVLSVCLTHFQVVAMAYCGRILKLTAAGTVPDSHRIPLLHNPAANIMFLGHNIHVSSTFQTYSPS
jgi:hypothetical protein